MIQSPEKTALFDVNRWRDQLTVNEYFYECFAQLQYVMITFKHISSWIFLYYDEVTFDPLCSGLNPRGAGQRCLESKLKGRHEELRSIESKLSYLRRIFINEWFSLENKQINEFFDGLQKSLGVAKENNKNVSRV